MANVIEVENLSKMYRLGEVGTGTLSHDLNRWWHKVRGLEDPYMKVTQSNDRTKAADSDYVWSLKDINFTVEAGDVIGIIGKNGAGKSTLLKILSRITSPTTGSVKLKGRIASLLEVGTGFHPEMTGRENIYMNGTIMGMRNHEITSKLEEIVEFAGISKYLDTPVKRYSSGMMVRLGFAIAAHLEPEILIVDEVLAVGDAEFQKKAIGKMKDVSKGEGRTVLFVSHNMGSVRSLCNKGIVLKNGTFQFQGEINDAVQNYLQQYVEENRSVSWERHLAPGNLNARLVSAELWKTNDINPAAIIETGDGVSFKFVFDFLLEKETVLDVTFHLVDEMNTLVFVGSSTFINVEHRFRQSLIEVECAIPQDLLNEGNFKISRLLLVQDRGSILLENKDVLSFDVVRKTVGFGWQGQKEGVVKPKIDWTLKQL